MMSGWKVEYEAHIAKGVHFLLARREEACFPLE